MIGTESSWQRQHWKDAQRQKQREQQRAGAEGAAGRLRVVAAGHPRAQACLSLGGEGGKGATGCMAEEECGEQGWVTP